MNSTNSGEMEMFVVLLKFSSNKAAAPEFMPAHNAWISKGFEDGVFQCAGSLDNGSGGAVLVHGESRMAVESRIKDDPFVRHDVVTAEILEITPKRTTASLDYLKA
jgi:uncharacterized protein YciI